MHAPRLAPCIALLTSLAACDFGGATAAELRMAVDESVATGQAEAVQQDIIEISTSFTLGDAVQTAIAELQAFIAAESACAVVTADGDHGVTIDFGDLADDCTYKGRHYAGVLHISVELKDDSTVVTHTATGFSNGALTLDGTAVVTWTADSRHVVTDLTFDREGRVTTVEGDRTQRLLDADAGLAGGIVVDGTRDWSNDRGEFALGIEDVEMRPVDPVPQAGTYELTLPSGNTASLVFTRIDADTIEVRVDGPRRDRVYHVTSTGAVAEQD
ncbi:MAG: hypothetical protein JNL82_06250 [Myxococcales bacterium]|nr:hypothetical protein [Myxococcales bacterium]